MSLGSALKEFAKLLHLPERHAEDALHSERAAKHTISRRSFFGTSAAMAGAAVFAIPQAVEAEPLPVPTGPRGAEWASPQFWAATGCAVLMPIGASGAFYWSETLDAIRKGPR